MVKRNEPSADRTDPETGSSDVRSSQRERSTGVQAVCEQVSAWAGVSVHDARQGVIDFRVGRIQLGHVHGSIADLPFPRHLRDELIATGRARPHHVVPESGWITVPIRTAAEVESTVDLFRQNYDRARARQGPAGKPDEKPVA